MKSVIVALVVFALFALMAPATAGEYRLGALVVGNSWARATPGVARNGAAYVTIENRGRDADRLIAVSSPAAAGAALHSHAMEAGVMKMRPVAAVEVAPGAVTAMKPGGLHIMLKGLAAPLVEGGSFPLTLTFERAGTLTLEVTVMKIGARHGRK
ncbi:MAG: copper chaperone PCu(A)C [Rhodospirillales bacterium]|jgi:hypothetical protein|nr:copper chaperone PCu(A)C [Rhodospirillales bacterium]MDP6773166.1 copper chaperone PCu(A)C [Rhodospirillales bacterium]